MADNKSIRSVAARLAVAGADTCAAGGALQALCTVGGRPLVSEETLASYLDCARDDMQRAIEAIDEHQGRVNRHIPTLEVVLTLVNAMGGTFDPDDAEARGADRMLRDVLSAIRRLVEPDPEPVQVGDAAASAVMKGVEIGGGVTRLVPRLPAVKTEGAMGVVAPVRIGGE